MKHVFVDTNIFLRFFTSDDTPQQKQAHALFKKAYEGELALVSGPPVLFELAWTLRRGYKLSRSAVIETLKVISGTTGLTLLDSPTTQKAIALAEQTGSEFADAYIAASANLTDCDDIATFNRKDFRKLGASLFEF